MSRVEFFVYYMKINVEWEKIWNKLSKYIRLFEICYFRGSIGGKT